MRRVRPELRRGAWQGTAGALCTGLGGSGRPRGPPEPVQRAAGGQVPPGREPRRARGADSLLMWPTLLHVPDSGPFTQPVPGNQPRFLLLTWPILSTKRGNREAGVGAWCPRVGPPGTSKSGLRAAGPRAACPFTASGRRGPGRLAGPGGLVRPSPGITQGRERLGLRLTRRPPPRYGPSKLFKFFSKRLPHSFEALCPRFVPSPAGPRSGPRTPHGGRPVTRAGAGAAPEG